MPPASTPVIASPVAVPESNDSVKAADRPIAKAIPTPPPPPRRPIGLARILLFMSLAACLGLACFGFALLHTPDWYTPPIVAPHARQAVRNNLLSAEQAFTESLLAGGPFTYHLFAEDINRWIATRREIYPLIDDLVPPLLEEPVVVFEEGRITIGGRFRVRDTSVILSIDIEPQLDHDSIVMRATAVRCGSVRMPLAFGKIGLDLPIERERNRTWPGSPRMWGNFSSGFHLDKDAWWKNGGIDYQVTGISTDEGRLNLEVLPLGRQPGKRRSDHIDS